MTSTIPQDTQAEMLPQCVLRPSRNDEAVRNAAVEEMLTMVCEWWGGKMSEASQADARRVLFEEIGTGNGFDLAREFEREGWDVDAQLVAVLDEAYSALSAAHRAAVKAWVLAVRPQPKLAIGHAVMTPDTKPLAGEIVRIDPVEATYTVFVESLGHVREGMGCHGHIYAWEAVEAINEAVPS